MLLRIFRPGENFLGVCLSVHAIYCDETGVKHAYVTCMHVQNGAGRLVRLRRYIGLASSFARAGDGS